MKKEKEEFEVQVVVPMMRRGPDEEPSSAKTGGGLHADKVPEKTTKKRGNDVREEE